MAWKLDLHHCQGMWGLAGHLQRENKLFLKDFDAKLASKVNLEFRGKVWKWRWQKQSLFKLSGGRIRGSSAELRVIPTGSGVAVSTSAPELLPVLGTGGRKQNGWKGFPSCFCNAKVSLAARVVSCPGFPRWPFLSAVDYITLLWLPSQEPQCTLAAKGAVYLLYQFCAVPKQRRDYLQILPHKDISALLRCSGEISPKSPVVIFEFRPMSTKGLQEF